MAKNEKIWLSAILITSMLTICSQLLGRVPKIERPVEVVVDPVEMDLADSNITIALKAVANKPPIELVYKAWDFLNVEFVSPTEWRESFSNKDTVISKCVIKPEKPGYCSFMVEIALSSGYPSTTLLRVRIMADSKTARLVEDPQDWSDRSTMNEKQDSILVPPPYKYEILHPEHKHNPFSPRNEISFVLTRESKVAVEVFDVRGKKVWELSERRYSVGPHNIEWGSKDLNGEPLTSGIYFYKVTAGDESFTEKIVLLK